MRRTYFTFTLEEGNWRIIVAVETFKYVEDDAISTGIRISQDYSIKAGELEAAIMTHGPENVMDYEAFNENLYMIRQMLGEV